MAAILSIALVLLPTLFATQLHAAEAFAPCALCHQVGDGAKNAVGPTLNGILGERAASRSGFQYSKEMARAGQRGLIWTEKTLDAYLTDPRRFIAGTNMAYSGLSDPSARQAVIDYLRQFSD